MLPRGNLARDQVKGFRTHPLTILRPVSERTHPPIEPNLRRSTGSFAIYDIWEVVIKKE